MIDNRVQDTAMAAAFEFETGAPLGIRAVRFGDGSAAIGFGDNDPKLYLGDDGSEIVRLREFEAAGRESRGDEEAYLFRWSRGERRLRLAWLVRTRETTASWRLELTNEGDLPLEIRHVDLFDAAADAPVQPFTQHIRLDLGEADWMEEKDVNHGIGYPVSVGDRLFLGVDWPVANTSIADGRIVCRQYCADAIEPGQTFRSRPVTAGACEEGRMAERFLAHLKRLRGRNTRRASFYFSWLTHSWEGLNDRELTLQVDFFERMKQEFGIVFDIYAVDAGVVETNLYGYERYKYRYERLLPNGLQAHADRLREMGTEFGIWIGPNEFGPRGARADERIREITAMVRDWNVSLIKLDTAVAPLLGDDPYENEHAMRALERLMAECRAINPNLIVINHRASYSPYILAILDSTLWEGRETYPDVHMVNSDKPRLFTRYAQHGFGEPTYFGGYSELLEDCGICINGDLAGWADEMVIQAFGRALMLSPEVYGALFLLRDDEYPAFGRLMRLSKHFGSLLRHTRHVPELGYVHSDGTRVLLCLMNDSWERSVKSVRLDEAFGLSGGADGGEVEAILHYPWHSAGENEAELPRAALRRNGTLHVDMHPFGVALVELAPLEGGAGQAADGDAVLTTLPAERMDGSAVLLGRLERTATDAASEGSAERAKFAVRSDPAEEQTLLGAPPSAYPEVEAVRQAFRDKLRMLHGIASNAWDGDPDTAWGDPWHWKFQDNIWRIDLGARHRLNRIELTLSTTSPGPVFEEDEGRRLHDPIRIEASADGIEWIACEAVVYRERQGFHRAYSSWIAGEFPAEGGEARYVRIHAHGLLVRDIRVTERKDGRESDIDRTGWRGNNLLTARKPASIYYKKLLIDRADDGSYLAAICKLPEGVRAPLPQEVAVAWLKLESGEEIPLTDASPAFPLHGWEWNTHHEGNAWTYRLPLRSEWAGQTAELRVAWYGPAFGSALPAPGIEPEITGCIVATAPPAAIYQ